MIEIQDKIDNEELNLPVIEAIDTPKYREAYADLMRTSRQTRALGLTYLSFLSKMKARNIRRRKSEFLKRRFVIDEKTNPLTYAALKETIGGQNV